MSPVPRAATTQSGRAEDWWPWLGRMVRSSTATLLGLCRVGLTQAVSCIKTLARFAEVLPRAKSKASASAALSHQTRVRVKSLDPLRRAPSEGVYCAAGLVEDNSNLISQSFAVGPVSA